jgi:serine/threonine-protein kinase HipA
MLMIICTIMAFFMSQRINGAPIPAASIDALMAVAAYFKLDKQDAVQIVAEVERTVSTWRVTGRKLGMSATELEQFADAFEHPEREVARSISRKRKR